MVEAIQAKWEIDEYAIIFFRELILNPPRAPIRQDERIRIKITKNLGAENRRISGATFCQVRRIKLWNQLINSITWGNQKWVGAIPAFTPKDIEIKLLEKSIELIGRNLSTEIPAKTISKDARD